MALCFPDYSRSFDIDIDLCRRVARRHYALATPVFGEEPLVRVQYPDGTADQSVVLGDSRGMSAFKFWISKCS